MFHYVPPLVLANVMHESTYRTLASHADTCRLDFSEIGRAFELHKGNFLAPVRGGGGMVGAKFIKTAYRRQLSHVVTCSTSNPQVVIVAAMALMVPRGDPSDQINHQPLAPESRRCKTGRDNCSRLADR